MGQGSDSIGDDGSDWLADKHCRERDEDRKLKQDNDVAFFERQLMLAKRKANPTHDKVAMKARYDVAVASPVGKIIQCPCCTKDHMKTAYNKVFCSNHKTKGNRNCKDRYWNIVDDKRAIRASTYSN